MLNFNVIVVTTDLSDHSLRALPYAAALAERFDAKLKLVCVNEPAMQVADIAFVGIDPLISRREHSAAIKDQLLHVASGLPKTIEVETRVLEGSAVDQITKYASEVNADLIVTCTHGRTGLSHVVMGSTAEALVRRAPCPVLTLKQPMPVAAEQRGA
jgi:nucleotide-binding universal stress UspA family protein